MMSAITLSSEFRAMQIQREVGNMFFEGEMEKRKEEKEKKLSQRKKRLERRNSRYETVVVRGKKEDKYDIDQVLSFVGEGEKDFGKAKESKTSKKAAKDRVEVAGEQCETYSVFEEISSLRSENELLKLDWMRLEKENCSLRSNLEAKEACEAKMKSENAEKLIVEKEQCRELAFELERARAEKWEIEKKLEMTAELWEREQFFGSRLQKRLDALEEELERQREQSEERELILEQTKKQIKHLMASKQDLVEMSGPNSAKTNQQIDCEKVQKMQKMKRHTSAITSKLQAKFTTLELVMC